VQWKKMSDQEELTTPPAAVLEEEQEQKQTQQASPASNGTPQPRPLRPPRLQSRRVSFRCLPMPRSSCRPPFLLMRDEDM
jgi:hypothetical protein